MIIDTEKLFSGDRRTLAKAITLIESQKHSDRQLSQTLLGEISPQTGNSIRIAISGIPGVGKSTFIESFGQFLIKNNHKVAVLAIDPSSPLHGGSILGDKTRMEKLGQEKNAYIRPTPTSGALGGVASHTRETILLCEAAGFDIILLETVGVGQSEFSAAAMVDFFMVLMVPNAGDELQGIKKGILELAAAIIVNKADGNNIAQAQAAAQEYQNAIHLKPSNDNTWNPQVVTCSSLENKNIDKIWNIITEYINWSKKHHYFSAKRKEQNQDWFKKLVYDMIEYKLNHDQQITKLWKQLNNEIAAEKTSPHCAATKLLNHLLP